MESELILHYFVVCLYCFNIYTENQYTMIFYFDSPQTRMKREVGKIVPYSFGRKL